MKKLLVTSLIFTSLSAASASAKDGAYIGFDLNANNVKYKNRDVVNGSGGDNHSRVDHSAMGFGLNAGYKFSFDKAFVAPEVFYDYFNNSSYDTDYAVNINSKKNDSIELRDRYGAKVNLGYNINDKFGVFTNLGISKLNYVQNSTSISRSHSSSDVTAIYGLGFFYNINDSWTAKLSVDRQSVRLATAYAGLTYRTTVHTAKLGLAYNF
jgi:outer membrane protein W